ncbi:hypothetical protein LTR94_028110, partial [Friedmanniomyces endolithicus]
MPLSTRRSSTRGLQWLFEKNGRSRSICSSVRQNRSLILVSSRSLNQIATLISMGPDPSRSQQRHDGDRIRGTDDRAEEETPDQGEFDPDHTRQTPKARPDQEGRGEDTDGAEHGDLPSPFPEVLHIDVKRAREQQERQHSVHQRLVKIEIVEEGRHALGNTTRGQEAAIQRRLIERAD